MAPSSALGFIAFEVCFKNRILNSIGCSFFSNISFYNNFPFVIMVYFECFVVNFSCITFNNCKLKIYQLLISDHITNIS